MNKLGVGLLVTSLVANVVLAIGNVHKGKYISEVTGWVNGMKATLETQIKAEKEDVE